MPSNQLFSYNADDVSIWLGPIRFEGLAEDTFVNGSRETKVWRAKRASIDGNITRSKSTNRSGSVQVMLDDTSPTNLLLTGLIKIGEDTGKDILPLSIADRSTRDILAAGLAWLTGYPEGWSKAAEAGTTTYDIDCAVLQPIRFGGIKEGKYDISIEEIIAAANG